MLPRGPASLSHSYSRAIGIDVVAHQYSIRANYALLALETTDANDQTLAYRADRLSTPLTCIRPIGE